MLLIQASYIAASGAKVHLQHNLKPSTTLGFQNRCLCWSQSVTDFPSRTSASRPKSDAWTQTALQGQVNKTLTKQNPLDKVDTVGLVPRFCTLQRPDNKARLPNKQKTFYPLANSHSCCIVPPKVSLQWFILMKSPITLEHFDVHFPKQQ